MTWIGRKTIPVLMMTVLLASVGQAATKTEPAIRPNLADVKARTPEFIAWSRTILLTPLQEKTKLQALGSIPAPCCKEYSIATCCCPCNLAKTVWGLANHAVARLGYDAAQTKALVLEWIRVTNKAGYSGNACNRGGCSRPFAANGCGGMKENDVVF